MTEIAAARLFDNRTPEDIVTAAEDQWGPFQSRVCLFSGGNDSLAVAHRCRDAYETLVWVDTGTAVPGVAEFVQRAADWLKKPVEVYPAPEGEYERIVLGGGAGEALGFPGPAQHARCYVNLKERAIETMLRMHKGEKRSNRVLALTGVRRAESTRRSGRPETSKRGALVFAAPLIDWSTPDLHRYRAEHELPESDVAALLHRSGECNCGAFAAPGEREMLRGLWPEWFEEKIGTLERQAEARGLPCRWGAGKGATGPIGELCSDCQLRIG